MSIKEKVKRSVVKSITFRILDALAEGLIIYLITKSFIVTVGVIIFSNISSTVIYFFHERAWSKIQWGKKKKCK